MGSSKRKAGEADLDESIDYSSMKVAELKDELGARGLPKSGKKADLVDRLEKSDAARFNGEEDGAESSGSSGRTHNDEKSSRGYNEGGASKKKSEVKSKSNDTQPQQTEWTSMKTSDLKLHCKNRGLSTGGNKGDLVERLQQYDEDLAERSRPGFKEKVDEVSIATGEHRMYPFVARPDAVQRDRMSKVRKQRMFMMGRKKGTDDLGAPNESFDIAGSAGSLYVTTIGRVSKCDCIDFKMGNAASQCKHILYCTMTILKAPDHLVWQRAFLSAELKEMFDNAPITQAISFESAQEQTGTQKSFDGEDCPICICEFQEGEPIVYCKAACGQNIHKACFETWKSTRLNSIGHVTCPYCRSNWVDDDTSGTGFDGLKAAAPRKGWHKNIGHLKMYQEAVKGS